MNLGQFSELWLLFAIPHTVPISSHLPDIQDDEIGKGVQILLFVFKRGSYISKTLPLSDHKYKSTIDNMYRLDKQSLFQVKLRNRTLKSFRENQAY